MAITKDSRYRMHQRLIELLGEEQATTLMAHLPPVGWADVATKRDVDHLEAILRADLARMATKEELNGVAAGVALEIEKVRTELHAMKASLARHIYACFVGNAMFTVAALGLAA